MQVIGAFHDFQPQAEAGLGPADELPGLAAISPGEPDGGEGAAEAP